MSWPSTDFEVGIQTEIDVLRDLAKAVEIYLEKPSAKAEALRNLKSAYKRYEETELADI